MHVVKVKPYTTTSFVSIICIVKIIHACFVFNFLFYLKHLSCPKSPVVLSNISFCPLQENTAQTVFFFNLANPTRKLYEPFVLAITFANHGFYWTQASGISTCLKLCTKAYNFKVTAEAGAKRVQRGPLFLKNIISCGEMFTGCLYGIIRTGKYLLFQKTNNVCQC